MGKILGVALAGWVLLSCQAGSAVTWCVDGSVTESGEGQSWDTAIKTIQEAMDTSDDGDTIIVARGTYFENIQFKGKNILLHSTNPLDPDTVASTIIDGDQKGAVVTFSGEEDDSCLLSGFTIQNGEFYSGGGIRGNSTRATISHNLITQNTGSSSYCYGAGIYRCNGLVFKNIITWNSLTGEVSSGGGLYGCSGIIRDNVISNNTVTGSDESKGGGLCSCSGTIQNNRITDNSAGMKGGGLYQCHGTIQNNLIAANSAGEGAGLFDCDGDLQNNTIFGNATDSSGGGLAYCHGATRNCIIWGNTSGTSGAQLHESNNPAFCCIEEWAGEGLNNISDDPRFVDPETGDYRLQELSPCLDAGVDYYWFVWPQHDLDGNCRLAGEHVDMGCYEYESSRDTDGDLLCDSDEAALGTNSAFDDTDRDGLRDGLETLRGSNPREPTQPGMLNVPSELPTIQAGLCLGVNGDEIVVAQGTYRENLHFCGPDVTLRCSQPGNPDIVASTVIDGGGAGPVVRLKGTEGDTCGIFGFTIRNGSATEGGGIYGAHCVATIGNNVISGNTATYHGGGICYCDGTIGNNLITQNAVSGENARGGGLYRCNGIIRNNTISRNSASGNLSGGGGLCACDGTIQANLIKENSTTIDGGGLTSCNGVIQNNLIVGNSALGSSYPKGGGLYRCDGVIQNNTIIANSSRYGGGLYDCHATTQNCIIWGNTATERGPQTYSPNTPGHCCIQDWNGEGIGNIAVDPRFVNPDGGDYRLQPDSPCIDTGVNYYWVAWPQHDMDGMCRLAGDRVDMGCYEYGSSPDSDGDLLPDADEAEAKTNVEGDDSDGDGLRDGLEVLVGGDPLVPARPRTVQVPLEIPSIQQALSLATEGQEIVIAPGTHRGPLHLNGANIILRSTDPENPDVIASTVIDAGGAGPVVSFTGNENEGCVLEGLTITGADGGYAGGIRGAGTHATIRNNTIAGNSARSYGGGIYQCHGLIENNTISQNSGSGLAYCDGTIEGNTITDNFGWEGGGLRLCDGKIQNNLVASNTAETDGGGLFRCDGLIRNNTIRENSLEEGWGGGGLSYCGGTIESNLISENSGADRGGGLYRCDGTIKNNVITDNTASSGGGLASCYGTIQNNTISGNEGGGLYYCQAMITNNIISANSARYGGGLDSCDGTIENNTIVGNTAGRCGGGLARCEGTIANCIIWGNGAPSDSQLYLCELPTYCCVQDWVGGGEGNITLNPHLKHPEIGDFHLNSWSPCIDAGNPVSPFSNEPEPNGGRVNMGAYGNTPEAASRSADMDSDGLPDDWELSWFGDLAEERNGDPDGDGVVNLAEYHDARDPTSAAEGARNLTKSISYLTIQAAISEADDGDEIVVYPGVHEENINFTGKNIVLRSMAPSDPTVVRKTILDGRQLGAVVAFSGTEDERCVLSGFTIRNGAGVGVLGGTDENHTRGTIQNNVITGNFSAYGYGAGLTYCDGRIQNNTITDNETGLHGGGLYGCHATIQNNVITGNRAGENGGGLCKCYGIIQDNLICGNAAGKDGGGLYACEGRIQNNVVADNSAEREGGGLHGCTGDIINCIIWGNTAVLAGTQIHESSEPMFCCIESWDGGGNLNISQDPLFVDISTADYHLKAGSPCVDAGADYYWSIWPKRDLDGNCRLSGAHIDIGCYEYASLPDSDGDLLPDQNETSLGTSPERSDTDGDGMCDGLEILRGTEPLEPTLPGVLHVPSEASTIQAALCLAWDGEEIVVAPGIYRERVRFLGKDVILRSANPEDPDTVAATVIEPAGTATPVRFAGCETEECVLSGFTVRGGSADAGGGICGGTDADRTLATIRSNVISGNQAHEGGGLSYCNGTIHDNVISQNSTVGIDGLGAGVAYCDGTIQNNVITENSAAMDSSQGGGLYGCHGTIQGNTITKNSAGKGAGAAACQGTIRENRITGNSATREGGGLALCDGTIENNTIAENSTVIDGGGLFSCGGAIQGNLIARNSANLGGGLEGCDGAIQNNLIIGNSAFGSGGGLSECNGLIQNSTIVGNRTSDLCGGLYKCQAIINSCVLWGNPGGNQILDCHVPAYSCIQDWDGGGDGNFASNPYFTDPENGDFHLSSWSPCIDAGDPAFPFSNEPEPNGGRVNMGAYGNTTEAASKSPDTDLDGLPDGWELHWFEDLRYDGDGDPDDDGIPMSREYCHGWNPTERAETVVENLTKSARYEAIQIALLESDEGDEIVVYPGLYTENIRFGDRNVVLRSTDPWDEGVIASTIIEGGQAGPVVRFSGAESETCLLSGFTIRNGSSTYGGGIHGGKWDNPTHATIQNNVIKANWAEYSGGGLYHCDGAIQNSIITQNAARYGGGLYRCKGTISNNVISGNSAGNEGGGLHYCDGTIQDNVIAQNVARSGGGLYRCVGTIRNNVITANSASSGGGGLCACGSVQNSIVAGNTADTGGGVYLSGRQRTTNCTIVENRAAKGGGVYLEGTGPSMRSCIIWGNQGGSLYTRTSSMSIWYNDIEGEHISGNIDANPLFLTPGHWHDPGTPDDLTDDVWENGDYRLRPGSPCIDAGDTNAANLPETDFRGMHRMMYGGKSLRVDMGAYEYYVNEISLGESGEMTLTWSSLAGKVYSVYRSPDMLAWELVGEDIPSLGNTLSTWIDGTVDMLSPGVRIRYYRIKEYE